ncbi:DNA-binding response regulator, NarL/FixJ family, contains REC and HTH domains [Mariniphaga anaerophila]|uniref:DNA-binding response regulator, NarL/FixJ family, contains REC and HTH domains n=1 Tax=Mariniphaga anaerophila TaxID=1484053 RepID=A0A1M5AJ26_9BACT|nr:LuxR C-terminal-related transcriptional regulator [Mariniphaga anaerophila]SHF30320.1 DNA-binding response regulator, NarL/FixJ family, contains REC and HTH domains [Mariniphaga anaerophila]
MNRKIFIIHSSEIVRKGINAILRIYFNTEIVMLEKKEELKGFCELTGQEIIIIYENTADSTNTNFFQLQGNNQVKWIAFLNDHEEPAQALPFCKFYITTKTQASQLQKMVSRCWDKTRRHPKTSDSEELTTREKDVLKLVALGHSNKVIAEKLFISIHTVISHRKNITEKTGIKSISGLTVYAILNNLIDTETINPEDLI